MEKVEYIASEDFESAEKLLAALAATDRRWVVDSANALRRSLWMFRGHSC